MWVTTLLALLSKIPGTVLSLFTGINFGAIGTGIKAFFASVAKYWQLWLVGVLVATNLLFGWEWNSTKAALVKERAAHVADIASFKQAQAEANAKAQLERSVLQKESKADADQADANYSGLLAKYHANLLRYGTSKSGSQQSNHNQLSTTQGGNGPSTGTELPATITISGDDAEICAENTARLEAVHDWAITLPKEATQP